MVNDRISSEAIHCKLLISPFRLIQLLNIIAKCLAERVVGDIPPQLAILLFRLSCTAIQTLKQRLAKDGLITSKGVRLAPRDRCIEDPCAAVIASPQLDMPT